MVLLVFGPSQHFEPMDAKYAEQRIKSREPEAGWNESELLECIPGFLFVGAMRQGLSSTLAKRITAWLSGSITARYVNAAAGRSSHGFVVVFRHGAVS